MKRKMYEKGKETIYKGKIKESYMWEQFENGR
jgi:hypothetical protein